MTNSALSCIERKSECTIGRNYFACPYYRVPPTRADPLPQRAPVEELLCLRKSIDLTWTSPCLRVRNTFLNFINLIDFPWDETEELFRCHGLHWSYSAPHITDQIKQMKKWEPSVVIETHFFQHSNRNNSINPQTAAALRETRARAQTARATRADARRAARNKVIMKIMHILHLFWLYEKLCFRWLRLVKVVQRLVRKFK